MRVEAFKVAHAKMIEIQPAQQSIAAKLMDDKHTECFEGGNAYTIFNDDNEVVLIGGLTDMWPGRAVIWGMFSYHSGKHFVYLVKGVKRFLELNHTTRRIEVYVHTEFAQANRLVKMLGFAFEGKMIGFNADGTDANMYAIINKV